MPRLNYLALMSGQPETLRDWYRRWFGFEDLNRGEDGTLYLTDGYFNLALMPRGSALESEHKVGPHHFGFEIESILDIERNLEEFDPSIRIEERPSSDPYAQYRIRDTEGVIVDLSEKGYGAAGQQRLPGIRHLAMFNRNVPRKFDFYRRVLSMNDATRSYQEMEQHFIMTTGRVPEPGSIRTSPFCGDGFVNVAILGENLTEETGAGKWGFNHFGILVQDPLGLVREMGQLADDDRPADMRPPERQVEYGVMDPDGNRIDVSGKKGWKVGVDRWARVE